MYTNEVSTPAQTSTQQSPPPVRKFQAPTLYQHEGVLPKRGVGGTESEPEMESARARGGFLFFAIRKSRTFRVLVLRSFRLDDEGECSTSSRQSETLRRHGQPEAVWQRKRVLEVTPDCTGAAPPRR